MMRMKQHCRVNPNNTSVADFDNYPRDNNPPHSPSEYHNEDDEKQVLFIKIQLLTSRDGGEDDDRWIR